MSEYLFHRALYFLLCLTTIFGAATALGDVAVEYHCAGGTQLATETRLTTLQKVLALRWTSNFHDLAISRLADSLTNVFQVRNDPSSSILIKPLLNEVVKNESLGCFGGASSNALSFILLLHLEAPQGQFWQETFNKVLGSGEKLASQGFSGRRWGLGRSNSLWMIHAQDWMLVGCGDGFSTAQIEYLKQIKAKGRPVPALKDHWLEAELASTELGGWFRFLKPAHIKITVTPDDDDLHINARLIEADGITWKSEPWQIPKELMGGHIISFTTGQNVAALLNVNPSFAHLASDPLTHQFYFWALDQMPFLNFMAWPVADASNALERLSTEAPTMLNSELKRFNGTELVWHPEAAKLAWQNMRLFVPALEAVKTNDHQFLFASGYPNPPYGNPASDALLAQIERRTNLVYYDWELTGRRMGEWMILKRMLFSRLVGRDYDGKDAMFLGSQWLGALAALVGNTTTEITSVAPNELSIERKAPIGFTAVELVLLANWCCGENLDSIQSQSRDGKTPPPTAHSQAKPPN